MRRLLFLTCAFVVGTALPAHADTVPSALQIDGAAPSVLTVGSTVTISGAVTEPASTQDLQIVVERSTNGTDWTAVTGTAPLTGPNGGFTVDDVPPAPGTYTYRASWAGDATYDPSADTSDDVLVLPASTLTVEPQVSSAAVGEDVTVAGTLSDPPNFARASIVVKRSLDGGPFAEVAASPATTDANGDFSLTDSANAPGAYTYRASWVGDDATAGSASATSTTTLTLKYASSLTLTRSPSTIVYGQQVTLKGAWSSAGGPPATANLTIERHKVGGGTTALSDALGSTNNYRRGDTPPSAGTFTYTVTWPGDGAHFSATSPTVSVTVTKRATTLSLDVTQPRVIVGDSTTLVATLGHAGSGAGVQFQKRAGGTWQNIGTMPVGSDRTATLKVAPSEKKTYRAVFDATTSLKGSASDPVVVEVRPIMIGHMSGTFSRVGRYAVYQCCTAYFYARLKPIHPKAAWTATVQYYGHGTWHRLGVGTYHFELDGDAAIFLNASSGYRYRVRGRFDGDADHLPASTPWSYFRFVK
jgi:hypothetical protein